MNVAVLARHQFGQLATAGTDLEARAHRAGDLDAPLLVADVFRQHSGGVVPLPRVVAHAGVTHLERGPPVRRDIEHHHQVHASVHLRVVFRPLRHAPQSVNFRQDAGERAATAQHREHPATGAARGGPRDSSFQARSGTSASTSPASTIERISASVSGATRSRQNAPRNAPAAGCETGSSTNAGDTCRRIPVGEVAAAAPRIDDGAVLRLCHRIDGEVAPVQVILQRDVG
jgi:hypothetical protein